MRDRHLKFHEDRDNLPAWIRRHNDTREEKYVTSLARALEWGFRDRPRSGR